AGCPARAGAVGKVTEPTAPRAASPTHPHNDRIRPMPPPTRCRMAMTRIDVGRARRMARAFLDSGVDELVLGVAHRQHRAGGPPYHLLRDAAQEDVGQPRVAVRAHDDEIDVL